jgi:MarR family transcriptional regulator, organic hydroperoxide resistance regulator
MTMIATPNGGGSELATTGDSSETEPLGPLLKRAHKTSKLALRRIVEPLGLTPVQADALSRLLGKDGLSLNELAERMEADAPTLSGVVECLVCAGYAERREDTQDRRRTRLFATEKARQIQSTLEQAEAHREALLTRGLSPTEVAQLKALLRRLRQTAGGE